jgi:ferredoxin
VCNGLKSKFVGKVDCVGVQKKYTASMMDNGQAQYTSQVAIDDAISEFKDAAKNCPNSKIVFGGYRCGLKD